MSNGENTTDSATHLVALIINQDQVVLAWSKFLVTIEAALAVGLGFVLKIGGDRPGFLEQRFMPWGIILVPTLGVFVAAILCIIIVRERQWQAWYSLQLNNRPGNRKLFPDVKGEVTRLKFGFVSWVIISFTGLIALGWSIVFIALVCGK